MIQFNENELSKIEDELYEALSHLEDAPDYEAEGSVNLLRVGQKMGQATQVIKRVNDIIGGKLRESKLENSVLVSGAHKSLFGRTGVGLPIENAKVIWGGKARPMPYEGSLWDEEELPHGSRD